MPCCGACKCNCRQLWNALSYRIRHSPSLSLAAITALCGRYATRAAVVLVWCAVLWSLLGDGAFPHSSLPCSSSSVNNLSDTLLADPRVQALVQEGYQPWDDEDMLGGKGAGSKQLQANYSANYSASYSEYYSSRNVLFALYRRPSSDGNGESSDGNVSEASSVLFEYQLLRLRVSDDCDNLLEVTSWKTEPRVLDGAEIEINVSDSDSEAPQQEDAFSFDVNNSTSYTEVFSLVMDGSSNSDAVRRHFERAFLLADRPLHNLSCLGLSCTPLVPPSIVWHACSWFCSQETRLISESLTTSTPLGAQPLETSHW